MEEVFIYDNSNSSCTVSFDREVVHITQELKGLDVNTISLYVSELEQILELAKNNT